MRMLFMMLVSAAILFGAYALTYGLPPALAAMIAPDVGNTGPAASEPTTAPPPGPRGPGGGGGRPTMVVTTALELRPYETILNAIGTATALRSVNVVSTAAGTVTESNLTANRDVLAGDVLVRLDARIQTLNLEIAQAELEQRRDTVARFERLRAGGNSTVTDVAMTEAQVAQRLAEAKVGLAQVALDDRTVRAPITGRLGLSDIDIGDVLKSDTIIASLDQADALLVEFELPERAIGLLADAKQIQAGTSTLTGRVFSGDIVSYDSRIDSVTRSVTVKTRIDNPEGLLWPGMTFSVRLAQESAPLPALPSTAITWTRAGSAVWIEADGVAQRVPVTIMFRRGETVWIDADIEPGTMVVTEGAQKLRPGARIATPDAAPGRRGPSGQDRRAPGASDAAPATGASPPQIGLSGERRRPTPEEPT